jgi:hypothetical protein
MLFVDFGRSAKKLLLDEATGVCTGPSNVSFEVMPHAETY